MKTNTRSIPWPDPQNATRAPLALRRHRPCPVFATASSKKDPATGAGAAQHQILEAGSHVAGAAQQPLRVLIVEDEVIIAMELEMMLEELEAEVVGIAMTAHEAEQIAASTQPDLITMDINLKGGRDGVDAASAIYKAHGIRSIFVSAYGNPAQRAAAAPANPLGWVRKPIYQDDLADILTQFRTSRS